MSFTATPTLPSGLPTQAYQAYTPSAPSTSSNAPTIPPQQLPRRRSVSPSKDVKPARSGPVFDLRAEEDATRRMNAGRVAYGNTPGKGKKTDLIGVQRGNIRLRLEAMSKEQNLIMTEEALTYLTLAAEARIRTILTSSLSAQSHRTSSNHLHPPSLNRKTGKPLYSHRVTSDTNAILEALSKQNKEAEQGFRIDRMDRLAKETEIAKAKERAELAAANGDDGVDIGVSTPTKGSVGGDGSTGEGVSTPLGSGGGGSAGPSTPVFGAVQERKGPKKTATKKAKEVSADVALKMSNMTAARHTGFNNKKYAWLNSAPHQSSPLAGKKRKVEDAKVEEGKVEGEDVTDIGDKGKGKEKEQGGVMNGSRNGEGSGEGGVRPTKRVRSVLNLTPPSRRSVLVSRNPTTGEERRVPDDRALTVVDVLFALEKDGVGKGMGTGDEILRRAWALGLNAEGGKR